MTIESKVQSIISDVEGVLCALSDEHKKLLKDTILRGFWGRGREVFRGKDGRTITDTMFAYRPMEGDFSPIFAELCPDEGVGNIISHTENWNFDGNGNMIFIRRRWCPKFIIWAGYSKQ